MMCFDSEDRSVPNTMPAALTKYVELKVQLVSTTSQVLAVSNQQCVLAVSNQQCEGSVKRIP